MKALGVHGDGLKGYADLLVVARAEAKRLLGTHENVNIKDILYSAQCGVHVVISEVPNSLGVIANSQKLKSGFKGVAKILEARVGSP